MKPEQILDRFENVKPGGRNQFSARCPCHDDRHNSLAICVNEAGDILLHCHAGCHVDDIVNSIGLTMPDLFADKPAVNNTVQIEYLYAGGQLRKKRYYSKDGSKMFFWEHLENGKWVKGKGDMAPGLYQRLQELSDTVFLVEGEKDVDTLAGLGIAAVSLPDGAASKWDAAYADELRGKQITILPDNDEAGRKYARMCAENLYGKAESVAIADLTAVWQQMPEKADITDLIQHFGAEDGQRLLAVAAKQACVWEPEKEDACNPLFSLCKTLRDHDESPAQWVIPNWIPEGQITVLASDGGVGKTTVWVDIVAKLSKGLPCILDPEGIQRQPLKVLFFSAEDSVKKKLRKKLREAGANLDNIAAPDFEDDTEGLLSKVKFGSKELEMLIAYSKPDLCIFDPIQGYIPRNMNMASRNEMRSCMEHLVQMGARYGTTFLLICHSNKRMHASGRDRLADSADLWDAARTVIMAGYTGDNGIRYLSVEKSNYGSIPETVLFGVDSNGQAVKKGTTWKHDKDFRHEGERYHAAPQRRDCKDMILSILQQEKTNTVLSAGLKRELELFGFSETTIERARNELRQEGKIEFRTTGAAKKGNRQWYTALAGADPIPEAEDRCQQMSCDDVPFA